MTMITPSYLGETIEYSSLHACRSTLEDPKFWPVSSQSLAGAIRRARALFRDKPVWQRIQKNGMNVDVSWRHPARQYAGLYRKLAEVGSH